MLLRTNFDRTKEILILNSDCTFSIERNDPTCDRRLAIFCLSISNILLINVNGEFGLEITTKVLQVAIYALNKLAVVQNNDRKTRIQFILRDQIESDNATMTTVYTSLK